MRPSHLLKTIVFALLLTGIPGMAGPVAAQSGGAEAFVEKMGDQTLSAISNPDMSRTDRRKFFRKMLNLHFDMETISRFALGRYWRVATPEQRDEYKKLLNEALINVYTDRFDDYRGEGFEVTGQRAEGNDVLVTSYIVPVSNPRVKVDWRLREKDGKYRIVDVIVQDVSMVVTKRSDFASVIQRGGGSVEVLLQHLRQNQESVL